MSQQIAQTKSHHQACLQDKEIPILTQDAVIDPPLAMTIDTGTVAMTIETDIDSAGRGPTPAVIDTGVMVGVIQKGATPGHITDVHITVHHATETKAHIANDKTLHIEGPHHTEVFSGIAVDPDHVHHTEQLHNII